MVKLIASDVDGTLLDNNKALSPEFKKLLKIMQDREIIFVIASGRSYGSIEAAFKDYLQHVVIAAENGGYMRIGEEEIHTLPLVTEEARDLIKQCEKIEGTSIMYSVRNKHYVKIDRDAPLEKLKEHMPVYVEVEDFDSIEEPPLAVSIYNEKGLKDSCFKPLLAKKCRHTKIIVSDNYWADIIHKDTDKGAAIKLLQKRFNIRPEECAAFGDNYNDIEMLESVGYGYAMKNAAEDIKKCAGYVTEKTNDEHGVVYEIKRLLEIS